MTAGAPALGHRFMDYRGAGNLLHDFLGCLFVAVDAEGTFVFVKEKLGCFGTVRVMTTNAAFIFNYLMQIFGLVDQELLVFMASPA